MNDACHPRIPGPPMVCPLDAARTCEWESHVVDLEATLARFDREARRGICDTGRYRCHYFVWGQGPPLAFIHGLSDCARSFAVVASLLSPHFTCIGYDLPQGQDDGAKLSKLAHDDLVNDLVALLDHLRCPQSYLLGSSFGATIALTALRRHGPRFPRAILQGGFAHRPISFAERLLAQGLAHWPGRLGDLPGRYAVVRRLDGPAFAGHPAELWDFFLHCTGSNSVGAVARRALLLRHLDLRSTLSAINQPVLMVCGEDDQLVGRSYERDLVQGLPCAQRVEIPDCGHFPHYTHAGLLAELIRLFLTPRAPGELESEIARHENGI